MWPAPAHMYKTASAYSDERAGDFGEHRQMRCKDASSRVAGALAARAGAKGASKRRACLCAPSSGRRSQRDAKVVPTENGRPNFDLFMGLWSGVLALNSTQNAYLRVVRVA